MINRRYLGGADVPPLFVHAAKTLLSKPQQALNLFNYRSGVYAIDESCPVNSLKVLCKSYAPVVCLSRPA